MMDFPGDSCLAEDGNGQHPVQGSVKVLRVPIGMAPVADYMRSHYHDAVVLNPGADSIREYVAERCGDPDSPLTLARDAIAWWAGEKHICEDDTHEGHVDWAMRALEFYLMDKSWTGDPEGLISAFYEGRRSIHSGPDACAKARADVADMVLRNLDPDYDHCAADCGQADPV